jgi:hypothetical protein
MLEDQFIDRIEPVLRDLGAAREVGESFSSPPLDVLVYYARRARLGRLPILGRALGGTAVVRQPIDVDGSASGYHRLLMRLAMAVNGRFPPRQGLVVGLTAIVLTPEPIAPGDDAMLRQALDMRLRRLRVVPFGLFRVNLGQEALALALNTSPGDVFPESARLADLLCNELRRYVPLITP